MKDLNWVEKYRPTTFDDYVTPNIENIHNMLKKPFEMPHLLLVSKVAGTGKTTLGKLIIKELGSDSLIMNSSNERRIEDIREKVMKFAQMASLNKNVPKIVMMDEFDGVTPLVQEALRNIMETYSRYCKFIITANNLAKIHPAIKSRCVLLDFKAPPKEMIAKRLKQIAEAEGLEANDSMDEITEKLIAIHYPSIRDMINHLQMVSIETKSLTVNLFRSTQEIETEIYSLLKNRMFLKARRIWIEKGLDCYEMLNAFMDFVIRDVDFDLEMKKKIILEIAETNFRMAFGADNEIQLSGFGIKFLELMGDNNEK